MSQYRFSDRDISRISNRVDDLVAMICPRDRLGVPELTREQLQAVQDFNDWLDENFGPIE